MLKLSQDVDRTLTDFLVNNKIIDNKTYKATLAHINGSGSGMVSHLLSKNVINEEAISDCFANFYGLKKVQINSGMLKNRPLQDKITNSFIKKNRIIPFRSSDTSLTVVIADPSSLNNVNSVKLLAGGKSIETLVTTLTSFEDCLNALDSGGIAGVIKHENVKASVGASSIRHSDIKEVQVRRSDVGPAESGSEIIDFVDFIIEKAIAFGASDIHFECFRESARLRVRRDGMLQELDEFNEFLGNNYSAVVTRLKILANINISERRLPQDGGIAYKMTDKTVDMRISVLPTAHGERVVMRVLDPDSANFSLDQLGIPEDTLKKIRKAIHAPQGMILVTGPTGSGKSTTLYAILKELNQDGVNILTAEDPVEFDLHGVGQVLIKDSIGLTFAEALRSFLRQDPEVIMVGEIRDKDTSDIAIKAALTGHLLLSTLHTNSAPSTITRMINMGIPPYLITASLTLVMAQRLARVICPNCKTEANHSPEVFMSLGFEEKDAKKIKSYKGTGCDKCMKTGIKGRRGIYEVMPITDNVKEAIIGGKSDVMLKEVAKKDGFVSMQNVGRGLVRDGIITVEEYQRILILE